jgi:DNA (cytosine-5)-methyltransferase 1
VADGVAARVDRLKAIGNGQVPKVAATAWKLLSERI